MTGSANCIEVGDYVRVEPTMDVWRVLTVEDDRALLSPSSISLAGRPRRVAELGRLHVVRGLPSDDDVF